MYVAISLVGIPSTPAHAAALSGFCSRKPISFWRSQTCSLREPPYRAGVLPLTSATVPELLAAPTGDCDFVPGGLPTTTVPLNGSRPGAVIGSRNTSPPVSAAAGRKTNGQASTPTPTRSTTASAAASAVRPAGQRGRRL